MTTDHFIVRSVTLTICLCTVAVVGFICYMSATSTTIPDQLDRLASLFAGAIIGYLVKTSVAGDAQQVEVVNAADDPVPVEAAEGGYVSPGWVTAAASVGMLIVLLMWGHDNGWWLS